ncbi:hypothetical protein [Acidovorax phage AP1]|nr:hypothetical protein [Acidovorax phage AP1]
MTDAEYEELKYAAIAAGYKPVRLTDDGEALLREGIAAPWNPRDRNRHSDCMGDALRLVVKLNIYVDPGKGQKAWTRAISLTAYADEPPNVDRCAAVCRTIVRVAAEIGKQMGGGDV